MNASSTGNDNEDVHIETQVAVLKAAVERLNDEMGDIFSRLRTIERLLYIGLGGGLAIGGIASFFGWNILKLLGK